MAEEVRPRRGRPCGAEGGAWAILAIPQSRASVFVALELDSEHGDVESFCAAQTEVIRALGKRMCRDIIEIGSRLSAVKNRVGHGNWLGWLDREFGWGESIAQRFMRAAQSFGKSATVTDLQIDASALYLLSRDKVSQEIRDEAVERAGAGERITLAGAERLIAQRVA